MNIFQVTTKVQLCRRNFVVIENVVTSNIKKTVTLTLKISTNKLSTLISYFNFYFTTCYNPKQGFSSGDSATFSD